MTFGKLIRAEWLKFDRNGINIYVRFSRSKCLENLKMHNIPCDNSAHMDEIMEKIIQLSKDKNIGWEFEQFGGVWYMDMFASGRLATMYSGNYDDFKVETIDLKNFKVPTFFIAEVDN